MHTALKTIALSIGIGCFSPVVLGDILTWSYDSPRVWEASSWTDGGVPSGDSVMIFNAPDAGVSDFSCYWPGPSCSDWIQASGTILLNQGSHLALVGDGGGHMGEAPNVALQGILAYAQTNLQIKDSCWLRVGAVKNYGQVHITDARLDIDGDLLQLNSAGLWLQDNAYLSIGGDALCTGRASNAFLMDAPNPAAATMDISGNLVLASTGSGLVGVVKRGRLEVERDVVLCSGPSVSGSSILAIGEEGVSYMERPRVSVGGDMIIGRSSDQVSDGFGRCVVQGGSLTVDGNITMSSRGHLIVDDVGRVSCRGLEAENAESIALTGGILRIEGNANIASGSLDIPRPGYGYAVVEFSDGDDDTDTGTSLLNCDVTLGGSSTNVQGVMYVVDGANLRIDGQLQIGRGTGYPNAGYLCVYDGATLVVEGDDPVVIAADGSLQVTDNDAEFACKAMKMSGKLQVMESTVSALAIIDTSTGTMELEGGSLVLSQVVKLGQLTMWSDARIEGMKCSFSNEDTTIHMLGATDAHGCIRASVLELDGALELFVYGDTDRLGEGLHAGSVCPIMSGSTNVFGSFHTVQITNRTPQPGAALSVRQDASGVSLVVAAAKPGDGNLDGTVDHVDLVRLLTNWGRTNGDAAYQMHNEDDYNADGSVNMQDLLDLIGNWG